MSEPHIVYSFPKGKTSEIRASFSTFRGEERADLRLWVLADNDVLVPTKSGISVPVEDLGLLLEAVQALREAA